MDREIIIKITDWARENLLDMRIDEIGESLFAVIGEKAFLIIDDREHLFDVEMHFELNLPERKSLIEQEPTGIVFEFGQRLYWAPYDKDYYSSNRKVKITFNQFKFIGSPKLELDMDWAHLGIHTEYELNNGNHSPDTWCEKSKFIGVKSIAICDFNSLGGTLGFQLACDKKGLKSIMGMSTTITRPNGHKFGAKLFVQNKVGWRNLLLINKHIHIDQDNGDSVSEQFLFKHCEGLCFVFGCYTLPAQEEEYLIMQGIFKLYTAKFRQCFWQFDSVEYASESTDLRVLNNLKYFRRECPLQPILINDSYYVDKEMWLLKKYINKVGGVVHPESHDQHLKTLDETYSKVIELFGDERKDEAISFLNQAVSNTVILSQACDFKIDVGRHKLPKYEVVSLSECAGDAKLQRAKEAKFWVDRELEHGDMKGLFHQLLEEGWATKLSHLDEEQFQEYYERLETELDVIVPAGFIDYFLILWDLIRWSKHERGIMVGSGRGSVAGSLIAYLLDITTVDPIPYGLLFERFLNKTRVMPEEWFGIDLGDGKTTLWVNRETKVKLSSGELRRVEELEEGDDIDEDHLKQIGKPNPG